MALSLLGLRSSKTISGLNRIIRILAPDIIVDTKREGNEKDYDGIFAHNNFSDPFNGRLPRILYLASGRTAWLKYKPKNKKYVTKNPPTALWVNQHMGRKMLKKMGIEAKTMYRPNCLEIPDSCPPFPEKKRILWHYQPGGRWMPPELEKEIAGCMRELSDIEIRIINADRSKKGLKPRGSGLDHVEAGGYLNLRKQMPHWHGIVRVYNMPQNLDYGRSTFQAFAYGRWYIYRRVNEPFVTTVRNIRNIAPTVRKLLDNPDMEAAKERWDYIRTEFTEEKIHNKWVKAVKKVICG